MALHYSILPVTAFQQNACLLWDDKTREAILTDIGAPVPELLDIIKEENLTLKSIWLTHAHVDHIAGVPQFLKDYPTEVFGPQIKDQFWFEALPQIAMNYGLPPTEVFYPHKWLSEGDICTLGDYEFKVIHIPGHSPGSVVYYEAEHELLIAGDVIFYESIGRTDLPQGNYQDLINNINQKILCLPDTVTVIPGHGPLTNIGHEKKHNPFLKHV